MTESIYADFEIDRTDLFRVNTYLSRGRLLLGLVFVGFVIAGEILFFYSIGEKEMLLQLSPLFIGVPLLGWGGQLLRLHAACRKLASSVPESQRRVRYIFPHDSDGFDTNSGESFGHTAWKDVHGVLETPNYFLLYFNKYDANILPKRGFHEALDVERFRNLLLLRVGKKAKLLKQ